MRYILEISQNNQEYPSKLEIRGTNPGKIVETFRKALDAQQNYTLENISEASKKTLDVE